MNYSFYDEMDELDDILNESTDEEIFIESMEELFEEKASQLEYNIRRFKEKYNFNPKDSTIIVDGHKYKVDMKIKDPIAVVPGDPDEYGNRTPMVVKRTLSSELTNKHIDTSPIILNKHFFQLKDDKRRAAFLQHEIAHTKLHSTNASYPHTDPKRISPAVVSDEIRSQNKQIAKKLKKQGYTDGEIKDMRDKSYTKYDDIDNQEDLRNKSTATDTEQKERLKARLAAKKYVPNENLPNASSHADPAEFEADRYAANKVGEKYIKRGIRELYKKQRNEYKKDPYAAKDGAIGETLDRMNGYSNTQITADKSADDARREVADEYKDSKRYINRRIDRMNTDVADSYNSRDKKEARATVNNHKSAVKNQIKKNNVSSENDYKSRAKALKDKELRNNSSLK